MYHIYFLQISSSFRGCAAGHAATTSDAGAGACDAAAGAAAGHRGGVARAVDADRPRQDSVINNES